MNFFGYADFSSASRVHLLSSLFVDGTRVLLIPEMRMSFRYRKDNKYREVEARFMI